jgi:hypothetical protein
MTTTKHIEIHYKRNNQEALSYWVVEEDDTCKKVSPQKWAFLNLPDTTSEYTYKIAWQVRAKNIFSSFGKSVDYNIKCKNEEGYEALSAKEKYKHLLAFNNVSA